MVPIFNGVRWVWIVKIKNTIIFGFSITAEWQKISFTRYNGFIDGTLIFKWFEPTGKLISKLFWSCLKKIHLAYWSKLQYQSVVMKATDTAPCIDAVQWIDDQLPGAFILQFSWQVNILTLVHTEQLHFLDAHSS